ncbi:hypothetical protein SLS58_000803 [Diplodia intermedia]|uniref:F-box domain-containing protein n=1 Tax=Diplodia intermedia TaxID=856260 RepID=A0ABR3U3X8_9PEZI
MAANHTNPEPTASTLPDMLDSTHPSSASGASSQLARPRDSELFADFLMSSASDVQRPSHQLNFVGISLFNDANSVRLHQTFPLLRPPGSLAVPGSLLVSEDVFKLAPRTLLAYNMPEGRTVTNVWPDRLVDGHAPARYTMYPLLEAGQGEAAKQAPLAAFNDWAAGREVAHAHAPPMINPLAATHFSRIPQEMFDHVAGYLSRDDLKALRLTSRLMRTRATGVLFKTVVIPFHSGMFCEELRAEMSTYTGKGKSKSTAINVFKSFGHLMQRFGVSCGVDEEQTLTKSYWGTYYWPADPNTYDETPVSAVEEVMGMKEALAEMGKLKELALSIDSGLGWLPGPDKSIQSQIIHNHISLFPGAYGLPSRSTQAQYELWDYVKSQYATSGQLWDLARSRLYRLECAGYSVLQNPITFSGVPSELQYVDRRTLMEATPLGGEPVESCSSNGLLVTALDADHTQSCSSYPILPGRLTDPQLAALMRAQWAQESLKDAFIIGVIDSETCRAVKNLNLACLPGRCLEDFDRPDFWKALPCLETLKIMVMGEIATLRYHNDKLQHRYVDMSRAVVPFKSLLLSQIAGCDSIKNLHIGWASGGEQATGMFARNTNLLPAPFLDDELPPSPYMMDNILVFPHVQHLTISNSWMTPRALEYIVAAHREYRLQKLTLDSISLQVLPCALGGRLPEATTKVCLESQGPYDVTLDWPFREWSWPQVLDAISPDAHFGLLGKTTRNSMNPGALKEIELISCGHSTINHPAWGLTALDVNIYQPIIQWNYGPSTSYFRSRRTELEPHMPPVMNDKWLATIIELMPQAEADALRAIWGATIGWQDGDSILAATLDGCQPGGTGRFSAVIRATGR